ncbi:MAG TPA: DsbA family protein [Candidatus Norongarragalinales archaeon]|nr:DsbA family protein [Candidatus Norongarragalinales archaeon]
MDEKGLIVLSFALLISSLILTSGFYFGVTSASQNLATGLSKIQIIAGAAQAAPSQPTQLQATPEPAPQVNFAELVKSYAGSEGSTDAKVTVVEFSDYQCPFCRRAFQDSVKQVRKEYIDTGKVRLLFRDFPLSFHPMAQVSAEAARCAGDQNKYFLMHDKMFNEQEKQGQGTVEYTVADLKKWAKEIGADEKTFNACLDSGKHKQTVQDDFSAGAAAGVSGTPTFFINGKQLVGAQPFAAFKAVIDQELANA